jgi:hypothetical protein
MAALSTPANTHSVQLTSVAEARALSRQAWVIPSSPPSSPSPTRRTVEIFPPLLPYVASPPSSDSAAADADPACLRPSATSFKLRKTTTTATATTTMVTTTATTTTSTMTTMTWTRSPSQRMPAHWHRRRRLRPTTPKAPSLTASCPRPKHLRPVMSTPLSGLSHPSTKDRSYLTLSLICPHILAS